MNLTGNNRRCDGKPKRRWSPRDDETLRSNWGDLSLAELAKLLDRTELTTYWRGRLLGLPCGCPQGFEYLTDAAKRTGFAVKQLRHLLWRCNVEIRRSISRPPARARSYHVVDPVAVDSAIALWLHREPLRPLADRLGVSAPTLQKLLVAAGCKPPRRRKVRWRIDPALAARLVAEWRAARVDMSVRQHAARVGLTHVTLANRLRRAGVLGEKRPGGGGLVRLPVDVVDRVLGRAA